MNRSALLALIFFCAAAPTASAVCVNRFVSRTERPRQIVTLLTGKLTFPEAEQLSKAIDAGEAPRLEWFDENGKSIAKQFGDLKVVRPMPFGCDGRTTGVVVIVTFPSPAAPSRKMIIKLRNEMVTFDQQTD